MHEARADTATQSVDPSAGPKSVVPVHAAQLASAVVVPATNRGVPSSLLAVQVVVAVQVAQLPALVPHVPVVHAEQTLSVVDVAETTVDRWVPPTWSPQTVTGVQTVGVPVL